MNKSHDIQDPSAKNLIESPMDLDDDRGNSGSISSGLIMDVANEDDDPRSENLDSMSSGNLYHVENPYADDSVLDDISTESPLVRMDANDRNYGTEENLQTDVEANNQSSLQQAPSSLPQAPLSLSQAPASQPRGSESTRHSFFGGHFYKGAKAANGNYVVNHSALMKFKIHHPDVKFEDGFTIKMELNPPGERHPNVYVPEALDTDPCSRLAVKATMTLTDGTLHEMYLIDRHQDKLRSPMIYNSVFDWLQGDTWEQIALANKPRRFVIVYSKSPAVARFTGSGNYTANSISDAQQREWDKKKAQKRKRGQED
jgi:hypothetical protein